MACCYPGGAGPGWAPGSPLQGRRHVHTQGSFLTAPTPPSPRRAGESAWGAPTPDEALGPPRPLPTWEGPAHGPEPELTLTCVLLSVHSTPRPSPVRKEPTARVAGRAGDVSRGSWHFRDSVSGKNKEALGFRGRRGSGAGEGRAIREAARGSQALGDDGSGERGGRSWRVRYLSP